MALTCSTVPTKKQNRMEFSIPNPFRSRGSAWVINRLSPRWLTPNDCFSRGSCLSTKETGDQWKITSPALAHAHTHAPIHTHIRGDQLRGKPAATYLSRSLLMWQLAFFMGEGAWGHCCVVRTRRPAKLRKQTHLMMCVHVHAHFQDNTCDLCSG